MAATKPSKKQRGKLKAAQNKKAEAASKSHVKFDDNGDKVVPTAKKRARQPKAAPTDADATKDGSGKADRSPEAIQQARFYLEQWKRRDEPAVDGELPWKFKKMKQQWILHWMYEADVVPKSMFSIVLEYLGGIQGAARQRVLEAAHEIIDAGVPDKEGEEDAAEEEQSVGAKIARRRYKRALQVAELLA